MPAAMIVHVVYRFAVGGLENGVVNLINRLPRDEWRHTVLALTDVSPAFSARITRPDVTYVSLKKPPGHGVSLYPALFRLFRSMRPAIVHTRNLAALEAVVPAWMARVPVRIHGEHGWDAADPQGQSRKYRLVRRAYRPFVHRYVALSHATERYLVDAIGIPASRVEHIYNGVDAERFTPSPESSARSASPGDPPFVIGTVGRLDPVKDQTTLVRAFATVLARASDLRDRLRLVIVGDGPHRGAVERAIAEMGISQFVTMRGESSDVAREMSSMSCFVLPSQAEGISNTLLEAMASALPVVATRVGANADLIEQDRAGFIVPPSDPATMATAIETLARDPGRCRSLGLAGREIVERRFTLDRMVDHYHALYRRLADTHCAPPAEATARGRAVGRLD